MLYTTTAIFIAEMLYKSLIIEVFMPIKEKKPILTYQLYLTLMAQRRGFEPLHGLPSARFPSVSLQPLGYLCKCPIFIISDLYIKFKIIFTFLGLLFLFLRVLK